MLFSDLSFIFMFLPLFFCLQFLFRKHTGRRNIVLFMFSLFFYTWGEEIYVLHLLFSIAVNYFVAILIGKSDAAGKSAAMKLWLTAGVVFNIGSLVYFKYSGFLIELFNTATGLSVPGAETAPSMPIGISFFTFQILSYIVDVYGKKVAVQKNILILSTYIIAFPQLIAGPIVSYKTVEGELQNRGVSYGDVAYGIRRFIAGLAKKVIIANEAAYIADSILGADVAAVGFCGAWLAMIAYAVQIYFDFSGYSDMAIGLGRMMGFHYLENFNNPYSAVSVSDFWRRWHISLTDFFRTYVYIPLGGNRVSVPRWMLNMAIVWILTGLWHGASFNYIIWGAYYCVILILEKLLLPSAGERRPWRWHAALRRAATLFIVVIGWTIFRCEDLALLGQTLGSMFCLNGFGSIDALYWSGAIRIPGLLAIVAGAVLSSEKVCRALSGGSFSEADGKARGARFGRTAFDICVFALLFLCVASLVENSYNPFIYFRF
jgi:alginate O-acetyltransferase complex protein AlgI